MDAKLAMIQQLVAGAEAAWGVIQADLPTDQADAAAVKAAVQKGFDDLKAQVEAAIAAFKAKV